MRELSALIGDTGNMGAARLAEQIIVVLSWTLTLAWLLHAIAAWRGMATLPDLTRMDPVAPGELGDGNGPDVTVIVAACNEEKSIEATLRSLLAQEGVRLEIFAVDDRSIDRTGACMERVAEGATAGSAPHRLRVMHIQELPAGWLGKPHAMALPARQATSAWLLFTDGDVLFDPRALELALRHAQSERADHLVLVPSLILETMAEAAMLAAMNVLGQWTLRLWKVADPRARDFMGVGGFNLIRREVYTRLGGFEAIRMEVVDDLRLGWMVKRAGYRQRVALGPGLVRIRWLQGALGAVHLAEKNGFAAFRFRIGWALFAGLALLVQAFLPLVAMAYGGWGLAAGLLTYVSIGLTYEANRKVTRSTPWLAVFFAPAVAIIFYAGMRSMVLALVRKGVDWRGTRYPLDELKRNAGRW